MRRVREKGEIPPFFHRSDAREGKKKRSSIDTHFALSARPPLFFARSESMGQIGYVLAQALASAGCMSAPIICQVVVDQQHEAFRDPSKFVGPIYGAKEATALSQTLGWIMKPDGEYFRRVVPSPPPVE